MKLVKSFLLIYLTIKLNYLYNYEDKSYRKKRLNYLRTFLINSFNLKSKLKI